MCTRPELAFNKTKDESVKISLIDQLDSGKEQTFETLSKPPSVVAHTSMLSQNKQSAHSEFYTANPPSPNSAENFPESEEKALSSATISNNFKQKISSSNAFLTTQRVEAANFDKNVNSKFGLKKMSKLEKTQDFTHKKLINDLTTTRDPQCRKKPRPHRRSDIGIDSQLKVAQRNDLWLLNRKRKIQAWRMEKEALSTSGCTFSPHFYCKQKVSPNIEKNTLRFPSYSSLSMSREDRLVVSQSNCYSLIGNLRARSKKRVVVSQTSRLH